MDSHPGSGLAGCVSARKLLRSLGLGVSGCGIRRRTPMMRWPRETPPNTRRGDSSGEGRIPPEPGSVRCAVWGSGSPTQKPPLKGHGRDEAVSVEREQHPEARGSLVPGPVCAHGGGCLPEPGPGAMPARPPRSSGPGPLTAGGGRLCPARTRTAPHQDLEGLAHRRHSCSPHRPPSP